MDIVLFILLESLSTIFDIPWAVSALLIIKWSNGICLQEQLEFVVLCTPTDPVIAICYQT